MVGVEEVPRIYCEARNESEQRKSRVHDGANGFQQGDFLAVGLIDRYTECRKKTPGSRRPQVDGWNDLFGAFRSQCHSRRFFLPR